MLHLVVGRKTWPLSKIGPGHVVPKEPMELDPCDAEIVMTVDGDERRWAVYLIDGAVPFDRVIRATVTQTTVTQN
ncbi:MAG: hypothetical protein ACREIV_09550, partial [Planctomycetaceae bacterium]